MKNFSKVIVAMMIMAVTSTMPLMASNDKNVRPGHKKEMRADSWRHAHRHSLPPRRPAMRTVTFKVGHKAAERKNVVATAKAVYGVRDARWNPATRMMTVRYDANKTSAKYIKEAVD